jgi:hypothetical protein
MEKAKTIDVLAPQSYYVIAFLGGDISIPALTPLFEEVLD